MAFLKAAAAGAAGAAAYNLYHEGGGSFAGKDLATGLFEAFQRKGAIQMAEVRGQALHTPMRSCKTPVGSVAGVEWVGRPCSGWQPGRSSTSEYGVALWNIALQLTFSSSWFHRRCTHVPVQPLGAAAASSEGCSDLPL